MRRKRMDDLQTVMDQVTHLQSENDELRAAQRRCATLIASARLIAASCLMVHVMHVSKRMDNL